MFAANLQLRPAISTVISRGKLLRLYVSQLPAAPKIEGKRKRHRPENHRIHVLGVHGSCRLGILIAHSLRLPNPKINATKPVTLLFHRPDRADKFIKNGCTLEYIGQPNAPSSTPSSGFKWEFLPPPAHIQKGLSEPNQGFIKNLIILPNEDDPTPDVLARMKKRFTSQSNILFLQDPNVFGTMEEVSARVFPDPETRPAYWAGVSEHGLGPPNASRWSVSHYAPRSIRIGPMYQDQGPISNPPDNEQVKTPIVSDNSMVKRLNEAHVLRTRILSHDEITVLMLRKLAMQAVIQPLAVIFRCRFMDLLTHPIRHRILKDMMMQEVGPIVRYLHKPNLFPEERRRAVLPTDAFPVSGVVTQKPQDYRLSSKNLIQLANKTCKHLDLEARMKPARIEEISGWFAKKAKERKMETQYSSTIARLAKQKTVVTADTVTELFPVTYPVVRRIVVGGHEVASGRSPRSGRLVGR